MAVFACFFCDGIRVVGQMALFEFAESSMCRLSRASVRCLDVLALVLTAAAVSYFYGGGFFC